MTEIYVFCQQPVNNADFIIPVEIDGTVHQVSATRHQSCLCVCSALANFNSARLDLTDDNVACHPERRNLWDILGELFRVTLLLVPSFCVYLSCLPWGVLPDKSSGLLC